MIPSIQPRQYFPISRLLGDPADTGTYYVQAVVKNARTGTTIATLSLTDLGNRLFAYSWQAVADPSGQGLFITITTHVFTDAAYTTPSDVYSDEHDTFLIYDTQKIAQSISAQVNAQSTVGSVDEVDYKKIKKIVEEVVKPLFEKVLTKLSTLAADQSRDLTELYSHLDRYILEDQTEGVNTKKDLIACSADILAGIQSLQKTRPENMQPKIVESLDSAAKDLKYLIENLKPDLGPLEKGIELLKGNDAALRTLLSSLRDALALMPDFRGEMVQTRKAITKSSEYLFDVNKHLGLSSGGTPKEERNQFGRIVKPRR